MTDSFDVVVVGGGPGGYVAAIRAAQLGARTAIVEKDRLGGTCTIRGCIPTKALLQSSELWHAVQTGATFGIEAPGARFNFGAAQERRVKIVDQLSTGIGTLMKSNGVTVLSGTGALAGKGRLQVGDREVGAGDVILATGSAPATVPIKGVEHTINSDQILELKEIPRRLTVIGGGVVGMEWGALFASLGAEVTVLEMMPQVLPMVESDLVGLYLKHFKGLGGRVTTEAKVAEVKKSKSGLKVLFEAGGEQQSAEADVVLLATGRRPYTDGLGLEAAGVETEKGRIKVDDRLRTSAEGVWAIGDVIGGIMLAHVASYEGVCAVENITGHTERKPDYHAVPNCIYTDPEIANVGMTEKDAREQGHEVQVGRYPLVASGRALTLGQTEGAVKVVADDREGTILGVAIVGPRASDVIAEATLAVQQRLTVDELDLTIHAHPTMAESLLQAALAAQGRAIEIPNRRSSARAAQPAAARTAEEPKESAPVAKAEVREPARAAAGDNRPPNVGGGVPKAERPAIQLSTDPGRLSIKKECREDLLNLYRLMFLIRRFEERAQVEYTRAKIGGYCHLNLGEEATVVGGIVPLHPGDYIFTSYREHGHAIARGVDPRAVMAELFGRESGVAHGRGGSMHIFDYSHRFMGGYGIVGGHLPLATGAGFSIKYRKEKDVVFCMFGDGATNIGAFHESLNFSKVFGLPIVWFCVNNQYGMGTAVDKASAVAEIYKKACAYDMESERIDGMDVVGVIQKTHEVVEKTRRDSQPRFIEAVNYRFKGHSVVDPDKYRSDEEKQKWLKSDPVVLFEHQLEKANVASQEDFRRIREEIEGEVDEVVKFADESPNPPVDELYRFLYSEDSVAVRNG